MNEGKVGKIEEVRWERGIKKDKGKWKGRKNRERNEGKVGLK